MKYQHPRPPLKSLPRPLGSAFPTSEQPASTPSVESQSSGESLSSDSQSSAPERPWPEQFKTPEELSAAYTELENRISNNPEAPLQSEDLKVSDAHAQKVISDLESKGLSLNDLSEEYFKNGGFSEERYKELERMTQYDRATIDTHIAGCEALRDRVHQEVTADIGGPDAFETLSAWARQALSPEALKL